ncbi:hypothetical protein ABZS66_54000, partial [Dactylosporangium sp. NPDC005572]|uniref:hypothetical protein n=1 Tax=Dactylosporangium sp. NPDC005572 TaxID=3156889 RepID=UPI0033BC47DD
MGAVHWAADEACRWTRTLVAVTAVPPDGTGPPGGADVAAASRSSWSSRSSWRTRR